MDHVVNNAAEPSHFTTVSHENAVFFSCVALKTATFITASPSHPQDIFKNHFICPHRPSLFYRSTDSVSKSTHSKKVLPDTG